MVQTSPLAISWQSYVTFKKKTAAFQWAQEAVETKEWDHGKTPVANVNAVHPTRKLPTKATAFDDEKLYCIWKCIQYTWAVSQSPAAEEHRIWKSLASTLNQAIIEISRVAIDRKLKTKTVM